ncbi:hypothetical protein Hanom_Chr09g00816531 [Helianthus anomalus]
MGYGDWVRAWVGGKRLSHHPGWAWLGAWPLGLGFQAGRGAGEQADMAGCEWPIQTSRWGLVLKKKIDMAWPRQPSHAHHTPSKVGLGIEF